MTLRKDVPAGELDELYARIERKLDRVGLETQPKVAVRILELAGDSDAQLKDYASAIKTDWALTGRILRLANSAFYAQRQPVTRLERALVLLGLDRTKAVSLGFYLSRAAAAAGVREISRAVWGQSVYRASLAMALARAHAEPLAPEAFVVGLMLDCGIPLMTRVLGDPYVKLYNGVTSPQRLYNAEFEVLEFTHVDVATVLSRRWKLPPLLARPIAWHHTPPPAAGSAGAQGSASVLGGGKPDPALVLQRVAYYAGAVQLGPTGEPPTATPLATVADRLFELGTSELGRIVACATQDYKAMVGMFSHMGEQVSNFDAMGDMVQAQLVDIMDEQMSRAVRLETKGGAERCELAGQIVEVEPGANGEVVAYISSERGERVISCTVRPEAETPESIGRRLGFEDATQPELEELARVIRSMAA